MCIPILIICYNNYKYVKNTIQQIEAINPEYLKYIVVIDNASYDEKTLSYLATLPYKVIRNDSNNGPWVSNCCNTHIYDIMPNEFILTDPDLEFNKELPSNFIECLLDLSNKYKCHKIGFALDLSDSSKMYDNIYVPGYTITQWEEQFWREPISDPDYELYSALIDTTFCLVNKSHMQDIYIRVAGKFTARHLPWYKECYLYNIYDKYITYSKQSDISTISKHVISYIESNYIKINKCGEIFFIEARLTDPNLNFWKDIYLYWQPDTFNIFDKYLRKEKYAIDIGGWIGTTCMYMSRKSKGVYVVEADSNSFIDLLRNCKNNCDNVICIENAIYSESNVDVSFGKNMFRPDATLNDSTSHIHPHQESNTVVFDNDQDTYTIKTITVYDIFEKYKLDPNNVSLIKVDIEGGEEYILEHLYAIHKEYNIPLYVAFHHTWWSNKDLDRFTFLTEDQKQCIYNCPFTSLTFDNV